jgi:hypothetical protein
MYKNKNHIVTCDNVFSNFTLFWDLLKVRVHVVEICRIDYKGLPNALTIDKEMILHACV